MTVLGVVLPTPLAESTRSAMVDASPLTADELASLRVATARDTLTAVVQSGGPLVIVPQTDGSKSNREEILSPVVESVTETPHVDPIDLDRASPDAVVDTLLDESDAASAAVLVPTAPLIGRHHLDTAAMRLRSSPVVVGPTGAGVPFLYGRRRDTTVTEPAVGWTLPALTTRDDDPADILPVQPGISSSHGLLDTLALVEANRGTARTPAAYTWDWMIETGITVGGPPDDPALERRSSD